MTDVQLLQSGPIAVDSLLSYARLDGDAVRVVLALPVEAGVIGPRVFLRLQRPEGWFRVRGTLDRSSGSVTRLSVTVPREQATDGTWHLKLREPGQPLRNLRTRLLLHPGQPVALLFGRTPNIA